MSQNNVVESDGNQPEIANNEENQPKQIQSATFKCMKFQEYVDQFQFGSNTLEIVNEFEETEQEQRTQFLMTQMIDYDEEEQDNDNEDDNDDGFESLEIPSLYTLLPPPTNLKLTRSTAINQTPLLPSLQIPSQPSLRYCVSAPICNGIKSTISSKMCSKMDEETATAARLYYQLIVDNNNTSFVEKKELIYNDLVVGSKTELNNINDNAVSALDDIDNNNRDEFEISYKIGLSSSIIKKSKGKLLTIGRFEENDIWTGNADQSVSRIQFFMFVIDDNLIILDGWSYAGTKTVHINDEEINLNHSLPESRFILRFNKNDTIHLNLGSFNLSLIINPKECIVCCQNARNIKNSCGHFVLCQHCYDNILLSQKSLCPICRADLDRNINIDTTKLQYTTKSFAP